MAWKCEVCDKKPMSGNNVSHAHNKLRRRWMPNIQKVRVVVNNGKTVKRMRVCTRCIKAGKIVKVSSAVKA
ncbi:MAG: 50S ribosomal protein L28 [Nitrospinae bacterium]|nr:50S ribosomal protein L28 [Nitrospinota bacterium]